jgi:hypothetical protein
MCIYIFENKENCIYRGLTRIATQENRFRRLENLLLIPVHPLELVACLHVEGTAAVHRLYKVAL